MTLSKLIAGPILRRVEKNKVSVWVAFKTHQRVRLQIWEGDNIKDDGSGGNTRFHTSLAPLALTTTDEESIVPTVKIGQHLYITVITAELQSPGLQSGKVYSYNVVFESEDPLSTDDLRSEGMLDEADVEGRPQLPLGYKKDVLPSFVLTAEDPAKLLIAQGSCRKMHGPGEDALSFLDKVIEDNLIKPESRPQQLFLTGDQIYADEVPGLGLHYAGNLDGSSLIGTEKIKIRKDANTAIEEIEVNRTNQPVYLRQHLVNEYAGFTSSAALCHLISFEEYCGLYLNYWSIRSWNENFWSKIKPVIADPKKADELAEEFLEGPASGESGLIDLIRNTSGLRSAAASEFIFNPELEAIFAESPPASKFEAWKKETLLELKNEILSIADFAKTLPKVSRVLANVSTYMIFDDHEVTDDWNITQRWKNQVLSKPFGRDIIRNGMMAYTVFQDWGNVPNEYQPIEKSGENASTLSARTRLLRLIIEHGHRIGGPEHLDTLRSEVLEPIEDLLGMTDAATGIKWQYEINTGPTKTYVLDTRTQREYESLNAPPGLLSEEALRQQTPNALPEGNAPFVFVISPAPVLGLSSFEELIQPAAASVVALGSSSGPNPGIIAGQIEFDFEAWGFNTSAFERLLDRLNTYKKVVLLSGDVHYGFSSVLDYWKGQDSAPTSRIVQLTASSLKNMRFANLEILKSGMVQRILTGFNGQLAKVGWKDKSLSKNGTISARNRARLRRNPAVVPVEGWEPGATVSPAPDFRWRLSILGDDRTRSDDPVAAEINLEDPNSLKEGYKKIVQRHQETFISGISRRIVWPSHVALIQFEADGASFKVKHSFLFRKNSRDGTDNKVGPHIEHVVPLLATGETAPTLG